MCTVYVVFVYYFLVQHCFTLSQLARYLLRHCTEVRLSHLIQTARKVNLHTRRVCLEDMNFRWGGSPLIVWRNKVSQTGRVLNLWSLAQSQDS